MTVNAIGRNSLYRDTSFRWLMLGRVASMLGEQFTLIALPWLVLKVLGDPLVMGTVMAIMTIPRVLFILPGAAMVDRHSAKRSLLVSKGVNTVLLGLLAALILSEQLTLWMIYALALGIGLSSALGIPASQAIMPSIVPRERLEAANGISMGMRQCLLCVGPLLAGALIALFGDGRSGSLADATGLGLAFLLDASCFAFSAWTLTRIVAPSQRGAGRPSAGSLSVTHGLRHLWHDRDLRAWFLYGAAVALLIGGPMQVALPVLAGTKLSHGAAGLGMLVAAHGAGALFGMLISAVRPNLRVVRLGVTLLLVDGVVGLLLIAVGSVSDIWQIALLFLIVGTLKGFTQIAISTWIQLRLPAALMARVMSLFTILPMVLTPLSSTTTGWLLRTVSVDAVYTWCGMLLVMIAFVALTASGVRNIADAR